MPKRTNRSPFANFRKITPFLLILALLFTACGGDDESASTGQSNGGEAQAVTMSSGYVCPQPQYKMDVTSKELNLFVWTEYIPQDAIDCFEALYGIKVNHDEYSANEEMLAKLTAGGATYDLVQPADYIVELMIRQGVLQKFDKSKLPVLEGFDPQYLHMPADPNNDYTIPYQAGTYGIVVNTEKVPNVPKSWADLWKPEYAGRMVFLDDMRATIGLTLQVLGKDINTKDSKVLEEVKVKLAQLTPGIKIFDSDSPKTHLIAGDVDLGMTWTGEAFVAQQQNPAIQYIYASEGTMLWQDNYAIPVDAPHLDAAYAWLNYSMQPDVFWLMLRDFPYSNPSKAALEYAKSNQTKVKNADDQEVTPAQLYEAYIKSNITNTPPEILEKGLRLTDVGEATPLYDKIWTEVKGQ